MLELMNAHQLAAFGEADATADELRSWLTTPSVDVERDIRVLERDGRLIGYADVDATRDGAAALVVRRQGRPGRRRRRGRAGARRLARRARCKRVSFASGRPTTRRADRRRLHGARLRAGPPLLPDGDRPAGDAREPRLARRDLGSHRHRGGPRPVYSRGRRGLAGHQRPARRDVRGMGPLASSSARRTTRRSGFSPSADDELAGFSICRAGLESTRPRATSAMLGVRRPWRARARRGAARCTPSPSSVGVATRAGRSASTRRARPARPGSTSGRACASTATRCSSSARPREAFYGVSRLRARCPDCRTLTAVAVGPEYQCHSCGREFCAGLVRVPRAWGTAATRWPRRPSSSCPYPEARVIEADTLARADADARLRATRPAARPRRLLLLARRRGRGARRAARSAWRWSGSTRTAT